MKRNLGLLDRALRTVVAVALLLMVFGEIITGFWGVVVAVVSAIFLLTSLVGICPLYSLFRLSTRGQHGDVSVHHV